MMRRNQGKRLEVTEESWKSEFLVVAQERGVRDTVEE